MKHLLPYLVAIVLAGARPACADLESDLKAILADRYLEKADVGVAVVRLDPAGRATPLFRHNADQPLIPASNLKLVTTSAAVDRFGIDFEYRTFLVQRGQDLVLVGDGDPSFGDGEMLKPHGWTPTTIFQNWAEEMKKAGLEEFRDILVDDSIFDEEFSHPRWDPRQSHLRYCAQTAGMTLNAGCIDFYIKTTSPGQTVNYATVPPTRYVTVENSCTTGGDNAIALTRAFGGNAVSLRGTSPVNNIAPVSITVHDPAMYAATVLSETLASAGVKITGKVGRDRTLRPQIANNALPAGCRLLAVHETTLLQVLARTNKDSMNMYAESLCKRLGAVASGESGSWANGGKAVGAFLAKLGVDDRQYKLDDGSGLSRENAVSPGALVRVLEHDFAADWRDAYISTLAIAGQDGTLDDRFRGTDLKGRVFAKSGYINQVSGLSGYLKGKDGNWYAFSILFNNVARGTNGKSKELQEAIVNAVDKHAR